MSYVISLVFFGKVFLEQSVAIYGNHFPLFVIEGCLLICCWTVEVLDLCVGLSCLTC